MKTLTLLSLLFFASFSIDAQVDESSALYADIMKMDQLLFEKGFNQCELDVFTHLLSNNFMFYHDKMGIQNIDGFVDSMYENICSNPEAKPIRILDPASSEVFPLFNNGKIYGAIQKGSHDFYISVPGEDLVKTGTAIFSHLWMLTPRGWELETVWSYNHQAEDF